jgi:hypothetical protein
MWVWGVSVLAVIIALGVSLTIVFTILIDRVARIASTQTVVYSVTGAGAPTITYSSDFNDSTQIRNASLPWSTTTREPGIFGTYSVTATLGSSGGSLTCSLWVDGNRVSTRSASGPYASVACTGGPS